MENWFESIAIVGLFLLRVGIPLLLIGLLTWWLRRLDARWQAEAEQARLLSLDAALPVLSDEFVDDRPCWEQRGCSVARREGCAAYANPAVTCWEARVEAEGSIPGACWACGIYHMAHAPQTQRAPHVRA